METSDRLVFLQTYGTDPDNWTRRMFCDPPPRRVYSIEELSEPNTYFVPEIGKEKP